MDIYTQNNLRKFFRLLAFLICLAPAIGFAQPPEIPEALTPWIQWVKDKDHDCPLVSSGKTSKRLCSFTHSNVFTLSKKFIGLQSQVTTYQDSWLTLPGDERHWPETLKVDGKPQAVVSINKSPSVWLTEGKHQLSLTIIRDNKNKLTLPDEYVVFRIEDENQNPVIAARTNRESIVFGEAGGKLLSDSNQVDSADIKVFRHLRDGVTPQLQTRIIIRISGKERILTLPDAAYPGAEPYQVRSQLQYSHQETGGLSIIAKPGTWEITVKSRFLDPVNKWEPITPKGELWPSNEYWALSKAPQFISEIKSGTYADASNIGAPAEWKTLPWYRMGRDTPPLEISRKPNMSKTVEPSTQINRDIWLPITGNTVTVVDQLTGNLPGHLAMKDIRPNAIYINDSPMPLLDLPEGIGTRFAGTSINGKVIWSKENTSQFLSLPALPYDNTGTHSVSTSLHLPPGWTFLGVDSGSTYSGWLASWDLLSFFLVLVASLGIYKLMGRIEGVVALLLLTLGHGVILISSIGWLAAAGIAAMTPKLGTSRWRKPLLSVFVLLLIGASVDVFTNARDAIHPELSWSANHQPTYQSAPQMVESMADMEMPRVMSKSANYESMESVREAKASEAPKELKLKDDGLVRAVGNTAPDWRGRTYRIEQGVTQLNKETPTTLYFLSPALSTIYHLVIAALILILGALISIKGLLPSTRRNLISLKKILKIGAASGILLSSFNASAEFPPQSILDELGRKVNQVAECHPKCSSIVSLQVRENAADSDTLILAASITNHSNQQTLTQLLTLSDSSNINITNAVWKDQQPASLIREGSGIWLNTTPGSSKVVFKVNITGEKAQLGIAAHASVIETASTRNWALKATKSPSRQGVITTTLTIEKLSETGMQGEKPLSLPASDFTPQFQVTREIVMADQWKIRSTAKPISPISQPHTLKIPVVAGENLITEHPDISVADKHFNVTLNANAISWTTALTPVDKLMLPIPSGLQMTRWKVRHTPSWIISTDAHNQVSSIENGELKTFYVEPDTAIEINVEKPRGIEGTTLAIASLKTVNEIATDIVTTRGTIIGETSKPKTLLVKPTAGDELKSISLNNTPISVESSKTPDGYRIPLPSGKFSLDVTSEEFRDFANIETLKTFLLSDETGHQVAPGTSTMVARISNNHWIWHTSAAGVGPVVVFWGIVLPVLIFAFGLGKTRVGRMGILSWSLILLGLTYATPISLWLAVTATATFIGWVAFVDYRNDHPIQRLGSTRTDKFSFTGKQILFVLSTVVAAGILLEAVANGLIGNSQTQILGNSSTRSMMEWVNDSAYNDVTIYSLPIFIYRGLVMAWAIWLAVMVGTRFGPYAWSGFNNTRDLRKKDIEAA